jgi:hypothetical protein
MFLPAFGGNLPGTSSQGICAFRASSAVGFSATPPNKKKQKISNETEKRPQQAAFSSSGLSKYDRSQE